MTKSDQIDATERLDREAHRWVAQLVSGEASTTDAEALKQWRQQSTAHEQAFVAATRQWKDFGPAGKALLEQGRVPAWTPPRPLVSRRAMLGGVAAGVAAAASYAVVQPPLGLWPSFSELTADYRTATGEQRRIVLPGDVSVRLNTQTSIAIPSVSDESDSVRLIAGEAAFAIPANARRPLTVLAGAGRTTANRARFDIRNFGPAVCVTCLEGEARVEQGEETAVVQARQQLRYTAAGLETATRIDPDESAAWQEGMLVFRRTPLAEVVAEINRYRPGKVVLINASLGTSPVNGRFRIQRINDVLSWIEQAFNVKSRSFPGGLVLLG
ncbi:FecR domain-containing protein [Microbacteriaceae bacterium K1510]|nr:FecR domain-containing protein [Microbacteriaceae bacterium K1510]